MSQLYEVRDDILNPSLKLSDILRRAKVLAYELNNQEFKDWIDQELNGYRAGAETRPDYRKMGTSAYGHFVGAFGSEIKNIAIPTVNLHEVLQEFASTRFMPEGIRALETMLESGEDIYREPWPADIVMLISSRVIQGMNCLSAWNMFTRTQIEGILDTVRNRLLDFILELGELQQDVVGESARAITKDEITQIFNTYVMGNHHSVAVGVSVNQIVTQTQNISQGDIPSLGQALASLGIDDEDVSKLSDAIEADGEQTKRGNFGTRVTNWIGEMTKKIVSGAWDVAIEYGPILLTKALYKYYGWE